MNTETKAGLASAFCAAQAEMKAVGFDSTNPFLKNRYASLGAVIETSRPILAKHGLSVAQLPISEAGQIGVETVLLHKSGESLSSRFMLPMGEEKGKSQAQVAGSVITYVRRYALASVLGLYADEDTDGNASEAKPAARPAPVARPAAPAKSPSKSNPAEILAKAQEVFGKDADVSVRLTQRWVQKGILKDGQSFLDAPIASIEKALASSEKLIQELLA